MWLCTHTTFCPAGSRICHCWKKSSTMWHRFNWWVVVCRPFVDINQHDNWYYWFYFYIDRHNLYSDSSSTWAPGCSSSARTERKGTYWFWVWASMHIWSTYLVIFMWKPIGRRRRINRISKEYMQLDFLLHTFTWSCYIDGLLNQTDFCVCSCVFNISKKNSYFFCDNFKANVYVMHCYLFSSAIMNDFVNFSNLFSHNINN